PGAPGTPRQVGAHAEPARVPFPRIGDDLTGLQAVAVPFGDQGADAEPLGDVEPGPGDGELVLGAHVDRSTGISRFDATLGVRFVTCREAEIPAAAPSRDAAAASE